VADHKDALKRNRQNEKKRVRNRHYKSQMRSATKNFRDAVEAGDLDGAKTLYASTSALIQRVGGKGIIHKNQASRRVSRMHKLLKGLDQQK
jgi:small subunit ribosomal protein S20